MSNIGSEISIKACPRLVLVDSFAPENLIPCGPNDHLDVLEFAAKPFDKYAAYADPDAYAALEKTFVNVPSVIMICDGVSVELHNNDKTNTALIPVCLFSNSDYSFNVEPISQYKLPARIRKTLLQADVLYFDNACQCLFMSRGFLHVDMDIKSATHGHITDPNCDACVYIQKKFNILNDALKIILWDNYFRVGPDIELPVNACFRYV